MSGENDRVSSLPDRLLQGRTKKDQQRAKRRLEQAEKQNRRAQQRTRRWQRIKEQSLWVLNGILRRSRKRRKPH